MSHSYQQFLDMIFLCFPVNTADFEFSYISMLVTPPFFLLGFPESVPTTITWDGESSPNSFATTLGIINVQDYFLLSKFWKFLSYSLSFHCLW